MFKWKRVKTIERLERVTFKQKGPSGWGRYPRIIWYLCVRVLAEQLVIAQEFPNYFIFMTDNITWTCQQLFNHLISGEVPFFKVLSCQNLKDLQYTLGNIIENFSYVEKNLAISIECKILFSSPFALILKTYFKVFTSWVLPTYTRN